VGIKSEYLNLQQPIKWKHAQWTFFRSSLNYAHSEGKYCSPEAQTHRTGLKRSANLHKKWKTSALYSKKGFSRTLTRKLIMAML